MQAPTPLRPDEEVAGAYLTLAVGGATVRLPVLSIAANREWKATFETSVSDTLGSVEKLDTLEDLTRLLAGSVDSMVALLVAYDTSNVLGGEEALTHSATDVQVYEALKKVTAAAFPLGLDLMHRVADFRPILMTALARTVSSRRTSGQPPSTAGRRRVSKAN